MTFWYAQNIASNINNKIKMILMKQDKSEFSSKFEKLFIYF